MDFLAPIAQAGLAFATLVAGIYYFLKKENKYQAEIDKLHSELRQQEKDTLTIIQSLTITMDKVLVNETATRTELHQELKELKQVILDKIESIKAK